MKHCKQCRAEMFEDFTEECVNLAGESNVLLLNGIEFAQLYFKSL